MPSAPDRQLLLALAGLVLALMALPVCALAGRPPPGVVRA